MSGTTGWIRSFWTPLRVSIALVVLFSLFRPPSGARAGEPIRRKVLVLYDGARGQGPETNLVAQICQTVLNYYGILPEYRDVNRKPLPDDGTMSLFRAVITSFEGPLGKVRDDYVEWLVRQIRAGRRVIILGDPGFTGVDGESPLKAKVDEIFRHLGLAYEGDSTFCKALIRYTFKDPEGVEFERRYPPFPSHYERYRPLGPEVRTYLGLRRTDRADSESSVIVTSPGGGLALSGFIMWEDPIYYRKKWYLNPFLFFREALGLTAEPVPDPTTLNGLRVAISHVDADGFPGPSRIDKKSRCAEIMRDEIFKRYDFPVTASVIVGEIDPAALGSEELVSLAREIFALPNLESASHTYSHPYYWDPNYQYKKMYDSRHGIAIHDYTFDPRMEIDYSIRYITKELAPPGRPCRVMLWSGNCEPLESHIARCDALGVLNMNGGDTVFDEVDDSYTSVAPLYRRVGNHYQVHTGQANDNILSNLWQGPYYGFRRIITTMERTGTPLRVAPIDIYYHFFSAEYPASLKALKEVYEWVMKQDIAPMFTSEYIRMVLDYLKVRVTREAPGRYKIEDYGSCLTLRFDPGGQPPDLGRCRNVIGFAREPQGLYVSLAPGAKEALIVLSDPASGREGGRRYPHVRTASGWVKDFRVEEGTLSLEYRGFGKGWLELAGMEPNTAFSVGGSALPEGKRMVKSDREGILSLKPIRTGVLRIRWN